MESIRPRARVGKSTRGRGRGMRVLTPRENLPRGINTLIQWRQRGGSKAKRSSTNGQIQSDSSAPSTLKPSKQRPFASSTSSSREPLSEISNVNLGYGVKEDSVEDEFVGLDQDQVQAVDETWCLQWPHWPIDVPTSPRCHSAASHSSEHRPESGLTPEPDITPEPEPTLSTGNIRSGRVKVRDGRGTRGRARGRRTLTPRGKFGGGRTVKRSSFDGHIQSDGRGPCTLNSGKDTGKNSAIKRTRHEDNENFPPSKQRRIASSTSSSHEPLVENEFSNVNLGYGSEEDSGDEEVDDMFDTRPMLVPRAARILFDESEDEHQEQAVDANLCLQWPPQPCFSPRCHSAASHSSSTPEPMPELRLTPEPDITPEAKPTLATGSVVPFELTSTFDFMWRPFPQIQIQPNLRRLSFFDINCGPTATYGNPYEAFTAIWDRDIMEHIAAETNRYAQQLQTAMQKDGTLRPQSRIRKWRDTDANELYLFFAVIIATGIVVKSRIEEYWSGKDVFSTPGFTSLMSFERFQLLARCLHFQNNDGCNHKSMTRPEAKLYKIKPILEHLNNKFGTLYNMTQNVALDESLTMWKGWVDVNQFIRNKAASVGIKTYEVCESQTGYLWRFEVHAGHTNASSPQEDDPVSGLVPSLVLRLLNGLEHKGHTIWMDNYYNSPVLARELKARGFDCVGTLRTNRKFVPQEIQDLKTDKMAFGQVFGCTSGDVDLVVWRHKKRVALISTYHGLATVKCGGTLKPSIIPDYTLCMGGLDRKNQMLAAYPIERQRTKVWYKKFFRRLLNVSVLNAYILLKSQHTITHRSFRKILVNELIRKHTPPSLHTLSAAQPASLRCVPAQYNSIAGSNNQRRRRKCAVCRKRTNTYCRGCNVPLCIFTCFEPHHYRE